MRDFVIFVGLVLVAFCLAEMLFTSFLHSPQAVARVMFFFQILLTVDVSIVLPLMIAGMHSKRRNRDRQN